MPGINGMLRTSIPPPIIFIGSLIIIHLLVLFLILFYTSYLLFVTIIYCILSLFYLIRSYP